MRFLTALEVTTMFCQDTCNDRNTIQEIFSRHDYQPKMTIAEGNVFGD